MINLLDEIQSESGGQSVAGNRMSSDTVITVTHTQSRFDPINDCISRINIACNRIDKLYNIKRTGLPSEQKKALNEVDQIVLKTTPLIRDTKRLLEDAKAFHLTQKKKKKLQKTDELMFENMFNSMARNYQSAIIRYQESTDKFRNAVREDFTRQAKIVDPEISPKQIQQMLEANDPAQYLQTHIMAISPQLLDEVTELEQEHERVKKLEKTIAEIQELFNACAVLVVEAGEKLDEIENNVQFTMNAAEKGKQEIKKAEVYAVQTRKLKLKTFGLFFACLLVLIVIGVILKTFSVF